jgi:hypothetical protein
MRVNHKETSAGRLPCFMEYVQTANETIRSSRTDSVISCTSSEKICRPTILEPLLSLHVREV